MPSLSFTSDMFKKSRTNESYIFLTAHWLNENFEFKLVIYRNQDPVPDPATFRLDPDPVLAGSGSS